MFFLRILLTALNGLRQNLLRSMLATLGVIIGVGAVIGAVSILEGTRKDILDRFETLGSDQVYVFNGNERRRHRVAQVNTLIPEDAQDILRDNPDLITAIAPQYQGYGQVKYLNRNTWTMIAGTTEDYADINAFHVEEGVFIRPQDVTARSMVAVLGSKVSRELFGERSPVGKIIKIEGRSFTVIGVMEERGSLGMIEADNQVLIPLSTAMSRIFGQRYLSFIVAQCRDTRLLSDCVEAVRRSLRAAHRIQAGAEEDFVVVTQEQAKQEFGQIARIFAFVLYSIAGISIVVGAIGIMNIMLVSVTERTREIGVRIAVGARRFDILRQFLTEASVISLCGGALGVVCGWAMANMLNKVTGDLLQVYTPPGIVLIALLMAGLVGIVSGIYPAIRAARLDPVQALRFE